MHMLLRSFSAPPSRWEAGKKTACPSGTGNLAAPSLVALVFHCLEGSRGTLDMGYKTLSLHKTRLLLVFWSTDYSRLVMGTISAYGRYQLSAHEDP